MSKYAVQLINRDMTWNTPPRSVQDRNGVLIGHSKYNPAFRCHSLVKPLTLEQYEKCADKIAECWHLAMRRWQPRFIVIEEDAPLVPAPTVTVDQGGGGMTATVVADSTPVPPFQISNVPFSDKMEPLSTSFPRYSREELEGMKGEYYSLLSIARKLKIAPKRTKKAEIIDAIMEAQATALHA